MKQTLKGHFPGIKIENEDRKKITELSEKIMSLNNVSSVSVVGSSRCQKISHKTNLRRVWRNYVLL